MLKKSAKPETGAASQAPRKDPSTLIETRGPAKTAGNESGGPRVAPEEAEHGGERHGHLTGSHLTGK